MKHLFSFLMISLFVGMMQLSAQQQTIVATRSADCTNGTAEFVVPDGKIAKLYSLEISTNFNTCNASTAAPTSNYAVIYKKVVGTKTRPDILYKKSVTDHGEIEETNGIQNIKLPAGTYILEMSKAPNAAAKLTYSIL